MELRSIFLFSDYKAFLRSRISNKRGQLTAAANYLNCGCAYLSRVLSEKMDLSTDQGFRICQFLELNEEETEYFGLLIEAFRAASPEYKKFIQKKIQQSKSRYELSQKKGESPIKDSNKSNIFYYSYWFYIPLHLLTSKPKGVSLSEAEEIFRLPRSALSQAFDFLLEQDLIFEENRRFYFRQGDRYLLPESPMLTFLHRAVRDQSFQHLQNGRNDGLQISYWFTMSESDFTKVRDLALQFIEKVNKVSHPSETEKVIGFGLDLFKI